MLEYWIIERGLLPGSKLEPQENLRQPNSQICANTRCKNLAVTLTSGENKTKTKKSKEKTLTLYIVLRL